MVASRSHTALAPVTPQASPKLRTHDMSSPTKEQRPLGKENLQLSNEVDIRMETAKGLPTLSTRPTFCGTGLPDIRMETAKGFPTTPRQSQPGFHLWERELLESHEVKRKATVAQLCIYFIYSR